MSAVRRSARINGPPKNYESVADLVEDFEDFCDSHSLSIDVLEEWLNVIQPRRAVEALRHSVFLHLACSNENITLEIIERLLEFSPGAVNNARQYDFDVELSDHPYPLHLACRNKGCPTSVVRLLINKTEENALRHLCVLFGKGVDCGYGRGKVWGLPIHYYLARKTNVDLGIVKEMVAAYPESLTSCDEESKYAPIHVILQNQIMQDVHGDIIQFLVEANPSTLQLTNDYGQVPLHIACTNNHITARIVKVLIDTWPQATRQRNCGDTPLHNLCRDTDEMDGTVALKILRLFLQADPDSASQMTEAEDEGDVQGYLPIHFAVECKSSEFCKVLIEAYPESVRVGVFYYDIDFDILPIHGACRKGRLDTVKLLYEQYPESIDKRTGEGYLPIHEAVRTPTEKGTQVVDYLLHQDPDGVSKVVYGYSSDDEGCLPLHLACAKIGNIKMVKHLFDLYPEAIREKNQSEELPIEIAVDIHQRGPRPPRGYRRSFSETGKNGETVAYLQTQMNYARQANNKNSLRRPDRDGRLPIHRALNSGACLGAVKLFVQGNTNCARVTDQEGMLPLHIACECTTADVVKYLVEHDDTMNIISAKQGSPLHHACHAGNCEAVNYLLDRQVASVSERNTNDKLPIHLLCDAANERWGLRDTPLYVETIWRLLLAYPETVVNW